jgi:hypothetical protein
MAQEGSIVRNKTTGAMGVIRGGQVVPMDAGPQQAPVIAPPDPYKQDALRRAQAGEVRADEGQDIARERLDISRRAEERAAQTATLGSESERTAGFLAGRVVDAVGRLSGAVRRDPSSETPTLGVEATRGVFGDTAANYLTDDERQVVRAAQIDVIDAALTLGTGAAYTKEQLEGYREAYFPKLGDSEEAVSAKRQALRSLLINARTKAGRAAPDIERAIAALDALNKPQTGAGGQPNDREPDDQGFFFRNIDDSGNDLGGVYDENGAPMGPEGGVGFDKAGNQLGLYGSHVTDDSGPTAAETEAARLNEMQGEKGLTSLAGEGMMLGLGDESAGIGTAIGRALTGDFDVAANYRLGRDADRLRTDEARDRLGWAGTGAEVLGGGALGKVQGGMNSLLGAGRSVAARGAPVTRGAIQSQMTRSAAQEGALAGGAGGFGYGEGLQGSSTNALLGAATGGILGAGGQRIGNALANRSRAAPRVAGAEIQQAADDLQIPVIPAVTGGTTARRLTSGARQGFVSDRPIARAVDAMEAGGGAARDRAAAATGRALDSEDAGNVVRQAADVYSRRTSDIGGRLYERADRMAQGTTLPLPRAVAAADAWLAKLAKSAEGAKGSLYRDVKKLRDQMAARQFEVEGIRQTRTALREQLQERGLRGSATDKVMGEILQAATDDLFDGLTAAGKQNAADALRTANAFWKKRVETIDQVLEPILGRNRSGEQIVTAIEGLAKPKTGNASRLRQLFDAMPANEARSLSATIITRMGQPTAGAAEKGAGFSFNTFLTNWNNMSPRARATMFPDETRAALDKLATVSRGVKQAGSAMNTSNTAGALTAQAVISGVPWLIDPMTAIGLTGSQWVVGRLLASPRVARWIAGAPSNPQARSAYIARLGGIARAEPAIANEIGIFEKAIRAANDNATTVSGVAAQEPEDRQQ